MTQADVFSIIQSTLNLTLELSLPILGVGLAVGVLVSLFQAITQINDATLAMVPKILAIFAVVAIAGPWMFHQTLHFATQMFSYMPGQIL